MPCFHPLQGYRARHPGANGKRAVVFNRTDGWVDLPVTIPCGQCIGCRLERSRQWAVRCTHEASLYQKNAFITLTYNNESLPEFGTLDRKAFPKFIKRLRRRIDGNVRYFHCGEYGEITSRPHYHACLFGFDFEDKYQWTVRNDLPVWRSPFLEKLWPYGNSEIGSVTFESAAYVARYILKKVTGFAARDHYEIIDPLTGEIRQREPEYTTMSRRPGIGKTWYDQFNQEVFPSDEIIIRGKKQKPPRYYHEQYEIVDPEGAADVSKRRNEHRNRMDETPERLQVREVCTEKRTNLFEREITP